MRGLGYTCRQMGCESHLRLVSVAKLVDFERGQVSRADFIGITVLPRGRICERFSRHFRHGLACAMVVEAKRKGKLEPATKQSEVLNVTLSGPVVRPLMSGI